MIRKTIAAAIILVTICSTLMLYSYKNARNKADEIMEPFLENDLYYYGTSFLPLTVLKENHEIKEWWGPSWWISYDHQTHMISGPLSFRINLFGKVTGTNPNNLLKEIIPKQLKLKMKSNKAN